ncbi:MAG: chemotaxis protein CheW [Thermoanaerobaculia bacterium]
MATRANQSTTADASRAVRLISFKVADELFVIDIMALRQIIPYQRTTPVPKAPEFIEGIIVLRNEVIPVIDLRERLFPESPRGVETSLVLVTRTSEGVIGMRIDQVHRILNVNLDAILPSPEIIRGLAGELFVGVIRMEDEVYLVLDIEAILSTEEKISLRNADLTPEE